MEKILGVTVDPSMNEEHEDYIVVPIYSEEDGELLGYRREYVGGVANGISNLQTDENH